MNTDTQTEQTQLQEQSQSLRTALIKIMPGYTWTIHKFKPSHAMVCATGVKSSGFNRLSTVEVVVEISAVTNSVHYTVRSAGFGRRAPWLGEYSGQTLARAFRGLQEHYEYKKNEYANHESALQSARKAGAV